MVQESSVKPKILIICGPTASGKSDFAVKCGKEIDGEIIGADSVQVYRHLNIGSGKITQSEMQGICHHMIDILEPNAEFSVSDYVAATKEVIQKILSRGKIPIMAGGTGLYINSLLQGHNFAEAPKDNFVREKYKQLLLEKGKEHIYNELKKIDPESAVKISVNDIKRIIRALEIYDLTGIPKSAAARAIPECIYDYKMLVLYKERDLLYKGINDRVEKMFNTGLQKEVSSLMEYKDCQSMQSIGYKETVDFLLKKGDVNATRELIKTNTRHYAKRQLTFFRGMQRYEKEWINTISAHIMSDIQYYYDR